MSADNYIFIDRKKSPTEVWACMASQVSLSLEDQKVNLIGKASTLEEAIDLAEKYENDLIADGCCNEYGINFHLWCK